MARTLNRRWRRFWRMPMADLEPLSNHLRRDIGMAELPPKMPPVFPH